MSESRDTGTAPRLLTAGASIALVLPLIPVVYLIIRSAQAGSDPWIDALTGDTLIVAIRSILLAGAVAAGAIVIALPLAWLVTRSDMPARRLLSVIFALPLVIPSYVGALAYGAAFSERGFVQRVIGDSLGLELVPRFAGVAWAWVILVLFTYPYVFLLVRAAMLRMDVSLERAARGLGDSPFRAYMTATLPQLRPAMAAGGLLCALYTLSDFGVVSILRVTTLTRSVYIYYSSLFDVAGAAVQALMLVVVALIMVWMQTKAAGSTGIPRRVRASQAATPVPLGRMRMPAYLFAGVVIFGALIIPVSMILGWSIVGSSATPELSRTVTATLNSLLGSGAAAVVTSVLVIPVALLVVRYRTPMSTVSVRLMQSGFALPGISIALALVALATRTVPGLYQTLALLIVAWVIRFIPQAYSSAHAAFTQVNPRLEQAARSLGASQSRAFSDISITLARPGIIAGGVLVFLSVMKELPATIILRPTGFETLATEVWRLSNVGQFGAAAQPALILVAVSALPLYLVLIAPHLRE